MFFGKTYLMLKSFSRRPNRDIYIITKSSREKYSNSKIKIKEIGEDMKPLNENENAIIAFDDILGSPNSRYIDQFFMRGRHHQLDFFCLSQSLFDLSKRTVRNNIDKISLFNQTLKDFEKKYRDVAGCDMTYDGLNELCRETRKEEYNYVCIDRSKNRDRGRFCICNESKTNLLNAVLKRNPFD